MRAWVLLCEEKFEIRPEPGNGTKIRIAIPISLPEFAPTRIRNDAA